jgi:hypothetical protein
MDVFIQQLGQLTKTTAVTSHCKHVAVKLIRRFKNGTQGKLELRYLLEDLLNSLPPVVPTDNVESYSSIRAFAKLMSGGNVDVPLKPKRPASIDASSLVNGTSKRTRAQEVQDDQQGLELALRNAQLLYDLFNSIDNFQSSKRNISLSQLLGRAISGEDGKIIQKSNNLIDENGQLFIQPLKSAIGAFLPPPPRGQSLREELETLLPLSHVTLSEPSADLLEGLTDILGRLCAPIRDAQVRALRDTIASIREYTSIGMDKNKIRETVNIALKQLENLITDMQQDLHLFKLGITVSTADEAELRQMVRQEAMKREKDIITRLYRTPLQETLSWIRSSRQNTLEAAPELKTKGIDGAAAATGGAGFYKKELASALVEALFMSQPVTVRQLGNNGRLHDNTAGSPTNTNFIPPILHLAVGHLVQAQNRLQAFTIIATLNAIIPASASSSSSTRGAAITLSWSERVWHLLNSEIQPQFQDHTSKEDQDVNADSGNGVHLANIADEVIKVIQEDATRMTTSDETKIRQSVDRMLRLEDPVFRLLHRRLKNSLFDALIARTTITPQKTVAGGGVDRLEVKGFSVMPLPQEMAVTYRHLCSIIDWACECWEVAS